MDSSKKNYHILSHIIHVPIVCVKFFLGGKKINFWGLKLMNEALFPFEVPVLGKVGWSL